MKMHIEAFYKMAEGARKRFPEGNEPFKMAARLLEECGEVAAEIHHWEDSGIKRQKRGEPSKESLANELRQAMVCLFGIAAYYSVEAELEESVKRTVQRLKAEGLVE